MITKDIFTHEVGHAVINHTANMVYQNSPGATNESFADIFGAYHDSANWTLGEGSAAKLGAPFRSLSSPSTLDGINGIPYPEHLDEYLCTFSDNGGVHHIQQHNK